MASSRPVTELSDSFLYNASLRNELLAGLSDEQLQAPWPRPGLNNFSRQFQEVIACQRAFTQALTIGELNFGQVPGVFDFAADVPKAKLQADFADADQKLAEVVESAAEDITVDFGDGITVGVAGLLSNLISHEIFHHGQMLMAMYMLEIPVPESWMNSWSVPQIGEQKEG